ncbi:MAG: hypothetical protein KA170_02110 [Candidatus Promineofilum sp.]|nr:hypothetical protein [Promineifilum sp.]
MAGLLLQRQAAVVPRFAHYYSRLVHLPRHARRALRRRLALTVAGAALLLALAQAPSPALGNAITVADGAVAVAADGKCSLREAILNANDEADGIVHAECAAGNPTGADTIVLPPNGLFPVTAPYGYSYFQNTGLPPITSDITLSGNRSIIYRPPGAQPFNLLIVGENGRLTLQWTSFQGGESRTNSGGAIFAAGDLNIADSHFQGNSGGAISGSGDHFTIQRSVIENNEVTAGGIVYSAADHFVLMDSLITGNRSISQASGGVAVIRGAAEITSTTFSSNVSKTGQGAALYVNDHTSAVIDGCRFVGNETSDAGGAIAVMEAQFTLIDSTVSANTASAGGGIFSDGAMMTIRGSTIHRNRAFRGGGIFGRNGETTLDNSTISGNTVKKRNAYTSYGGEGGGVMGYDELITLINTTITGNDATVEGGGVWLRTGGLYGPGGLTAKRTVITGNNAPKGPQVVAKSDEFVNLDDFNLFGANGNAGLVGLMPGPSDIVPPVGVSAANIVRPTLFPNGGPTLTHALPPGSPAIDAAPSAACAGQTDQRGVARNYDGDGSPSANECDIGAFEWANEPDFDESLLLPLVVR